MIKETRTVQGWRKGLAGLLIGASLTFGGCGGVRPGDEITLKVTESRKVSGVTKEIHMIYGGMPNSDIFTLYEHEESNSYYPVEAEKIHFHGHDYEVLYVNPEEIKLKKIR